MARVQLRRDLEDMIAHLGGVAASVHAEGSEIGAKAEGLLAVHRKTGAARIETSHTRTDSFVSLVDNTPQDSGAAPAVAIEYGHRDSKSGEHVEGLYIITKAAGFA